MRLASKNNNPSIFLPNSCPFCSWYADFLPRARHQHSMSSLFINSGTYTLCSILLFFQYNLSIYYLRLASKNNSPSFFKANSNYYYNQKLEELAMFSHTNISVGQWKTFGWTIMEIFVGKMFYYIMNCRINWSRNKRGVL